MPMQKLVIPTGFEDIQRQAERRRKIAEALMSRALTPQSGMQSWTQVLGQALAGGIGRLNDRRADKLQKEYEDKLTGAYNSANDSFQADAKTMTPQQLDAKYGSNPYVQDALDPYQKAMAHGLEQRENLINYGGKVGVRQGDVAGSYDPGKVTDMVRTDPKTGEPYVNPYRMMGAIGSQFQPATNDIGAFINYKAPPGTGGRPPISGDGQVDNPNMMDVSKLSPDERSIITRELARRAGIPNSAPSSNVPSGSPLVKPPSGKTIDGRPYWLINGVPYDNPEGR